MKPTIAAWIGDADALRYQQQFGVQHETLRLAHIRSRADDYYVALLGELFDKLRVGYGDSNDWARLGNALAQYASALRQNTFSNPGVSASQALLLSAAAFYTGGFPASAYLTVREADFPSPADPSRACFELLSRPTQIQSELVARLVDALRRGDMDTISQEAERARRASERAMGIGPEEWMIARLGEQLLSKFALTNVRAILPEGETELWDPLVNSFLAQRPPVWDFFPSQVSAIEQGLLTRNETFSLQMPTGAGKTALCETLLYSHVRQRPEHIAVLLVPYRSLASELRFTLVRRLNAMGIPSRCAYGGTVPSGDEVYAIEDTRVLVATPESLSGLLTADPRFFKRISLVICDEGHLLDGGGRGVGLELLLARLRGRESGAPRFIFISAIVPNIEEINLWLGGTPETVARSDYRPAMAEYAVLQAGTKGGASTLDLVMHPHEPHPVQFAVEGFLQADDFKWYNSKTRRWNTMPFGSFKRRAVAAARKALPLGPVALFAANKSGQQGAIGLAEELLEQLERNLRLPRPDAFTNRESIQPTVDYVEREYGTAWVGTRALAAGAVLHHGDIPQETREVFEMVVRRELVKLAICTNTLAEGVNLPIRTMVLYSVRRGTASGRAEDLLARDIKNLVGRAGRAGSTTKGLVICANHEQWPLVERVARQENGERVAGALLRLTNNLRSALARTGWQLSNELLENSPSLFALVDGIDATVVDLAIEEVGGDELAAIAVHLADQTFAFRQLDEASKRALEEVFELRARRIAELRTSGRLKWIHETGARPRILSTVLDQLYTSWDGWQSVADSMDPALFTALLEWAWLQPELREAVRDSYRLTGSESVELKKASFFTLVRQWILGASYSAIAEQASLTVDETLAVHAKAVGYCLQMQIEQAVAILERLADTFGVQLAPAVSSFPSCLRFGVSSAAAVEFALKGVRHRRAAIELSEDASIKGMEWAGAEPMLVEARDSLRTREREWRTRLGSLVYSRTVEDVAQALRHTEDVQ